jgi:hypothetical protein
MAGVNPRRHRSGWWVAALVGGCAALLAVIRACPYAGGWNDGSRLATVEALVDAHTLAIDHSIFVEVPLPPHPVPYPAGEPVLLHHGTLDKLFIGGHYYSDKSPVPAVLLAGFYQLWQWTTGWTARMHPDHFCRAMTLASSGLAYVLAVLGMFVLGGRLRLVVPLRLLLAASFGLATVALPYADHVNNHILLLGVTTWLTVGVHLLGEESRRGKVNLVRLGLLGALAGVGYTIDLGVGPVLLGCTLILVAACCRRFRAVAVFAGAALPWLALHHALNYAVGGTWVPANAVADSFRWPGSPFSPRNLTGGWAHAGAGTFLLYAASMLFGKRGFFGHNLPLFLLLPALGPLLRLRARRPEVWWALGCCGGAWLLYAATSNNSSGQCLSIRWFVPLLGPAYLLLGLALRLRSGLRIAFVLLSAWGGLLMLLMREGSWGKHMVPGFWVIQAAALASCACLARFRRGADRRPPARLTCSHPSYFLFRDGRCDRARSVPPAAFPGNR